MGLSTVKSKLVAEIPVPLHSETTSQFLCGLERGGINPRAVWNKSTRKYEDIFEDDLKKYFIDAKIHETKLDGLKKVLVVDFFNLDSREAVPMYRLLMTGAEFTTYEYHTKRFRDSMLDKLLERVFFSSWHAQESDTSRTIIGDEQTQIISGFLHITSLNWNDAILKKQQRIREDQLEAKYKKIRERIDMEMVIIPHPLLQKNLESWAENHVFLENRYIVYHRVGKKVVGYCSHCHAEVTLPTARNNESGVCPQCNSKVVLKALGRTKESCRINKRLAVMQKCKNGLVVRLYSATKHFYGMFSSSELYIDEDVRTICREGGAKTYYHDFFCNTSKVRWCSSYRAQSEFGDLTAYIYTPNLKRVLNGTPYQYCALYEYGKSERSINVAQYLDRYLQHPQLEYLVKLKLYKLAQYLVTYGYSGDELNGNTIAEVLQVGKNYVPVLQELDVSCDELKLFREADRSGRILTKENIQYLRNHKIMSGYRVDNQTLSPIIRNVPFSAALNYCYGLAVEKCEKAKKEPHYCGCYGYRNSQGKPDDWLDETIKDYRDYINECCDLELDLKNKQIAFPRDFYAAHARMSAQIRALTNKLDLRKIVAVAAKYARYNMATEMLSITVAKTAAEIIYEGKILSHCVGGYVTHVASGTSVIFLLRKTDEPSVPYYTVELDPDNLKVMQYRGYKNNNVGNPVPQEIHDFVDAWKKHIKQVCTNKRVKQENRVAVAAV